MTQLRRIARSISNKYPYIAHSKINELSAASFAIDQTIKDWLNSTQLSFIKKLTNATIKQLRQNEIKCVKQLRVN